MFRKTDDRALRKMLTEAIKEKGGHCPCAIELSEDTLCPCKEFREMESGVCGCGLYIKE